MDEQLRLQYIRHTCSVQGWTLLVYLGIMNAAVIVVTIFGAIAQAITGSMNMDQLMDASGWGYFLSIGIGLLILLLWKKPEFCFHTLWQRGKPMKTGRFLGILAVFLSIQMLAVLLSLLMDWIAWIAGFEMTDMGDISTDSLSMFLYVGLGAPISEELLFRGLILRSLEPFGKKFSIFASALLFGLFHGNLSQAPFAVGVGVILGYVTLEHNIGWAMVLHMFNNLILSDTLFRLLSHWFGDWGAALMWGVILLFSLAAVVVLIVQRKKIVAYLRREYDDPLCTRAFFSAPGIIVLLIVLALTIAFTTFSSLVSV